MANMFNDSKKVSANYQVSALDGMLEIDVTSGPISLRLPNSANLRKGDAFLFYHDQGDISVNNIFLDAEHVGGINGQGNYSMYQPNQAVLVFYTGARFIIGSVQ
jgi:hypothetical protein